MHKWNWGDLEYILAVASEGSAAAAARRLGVSHATVIRRVKSFETNWPEPIFEHRRDGYRLTEKGRIFLDAAESIGATLSDLERKAVQGEDKPAGNVRITTTDSLFPILAEELQAFHGIYPDITLDLTMTNQRLDLFNRDADIAVRPSHEPPPDLIGRRVGRLDMAMYFHRSLQKKETLSDIPWIGFDQPVLSSGLGKEIASFIEDFRVVARVDSFVGAQRLAEAKVGCTFLPTYLGDPSDRLTLLARDQLSLKVDIWLLTHKDIARALRVKVCTDYLFQALKRRFGLPDFKNPAI